MSPLLLIRPGRPRIPMRRWACVLTLLGLTLGGVTASPAQTAGKTATALEKGRADGDGRPAAKAEGPAPGTSSATTSADRGERTERPERALPASDVFGSQMFRGQFAARSFSGFNPDYQLAVGDRVMLRLWGAYALDTTQVVDPRGNIFIPNIGPVRVQGVRNAELNDVVQSQVKRVFRANVQSYASLEVAQPVKLYVTGFVRQPGLYNGLSSDSVLHYLDQAGGIDPDRGSFLRVDVLRGGKPRAALDLYRFLLAGQIDSLQLHDGDTIFVPPRQYSVKVTGEVANANVFELPKRETTLAELLKIARPKAAATHVAIARQVGTERRSEYHPIAQAEQVAVLDGDELTVTADTVPGTMLVRIDGAHRGQRSVILPYGARLKDALAQVQPAAQAEVPSLQLYRRSIAARQKEMLAVSLEKLETQALTGRSATNEEANLRSREAEMVMQFTARARTIEPKGRLIFNELAAAGDTLLEDGDLLVIPETSSQVTLHGEVMFPMAMQMERRRTVTQLIALAGGYTQNADTSRVLLIRRNGSVSEVKGDAVPDPGEELMVLPKADSKNIEITRGITQILYQIAIAAKIALGL